MLTTLKFLNIGKQFPPKSERYRIKLYERNKLLYDGHHEYCLYNTKLYKSLKLNWFSRISTLWADLLVGEQPKFTTQEYNSDEQKQLDHIVLDTQLVKKIYQCAIDVSRYGTGILRLRYVNSKVLIETQPPQFWFPIVSLTNINDIEKHVLCWKYAVDTEDDSICCDDENKCISKIEKLYVEIHERGYITYRTYSMSNNSIVALDSSETQRTNINEFLIFPVNHLQSSDSCYGVDDYSDIFEIIEEMQVRFGQISKILNEHSNPKLLGDRAYLEEDAGGQKNFNYDDGFIAVDDRLVQPKYLTWNGELENNFKYLDYLEKQLYVVSSTSPALFGHTSASAESGSALRRLALASIAKTTRIRTSFDKVIKDLIRIYTEFENANKTNQVNVLDNVSIEWFDGLPNDYSEMVRSEAERKYASLTSTKSALQRLDGISGDVLEHELQLIKEENAEKNDSTIRRQSEVSLENMRYAVDKSEDNKIK